MVTTGDGLHVYLHDPDGKLGTLTKFGPGVEARGAGYYVASPPSIHPSGRRYTWAKGCGPVETRGLPPIPRSLLAVLAPDPPAEVPTRKTPAPCRSRSGRAGLPTPYGAKAIDGLLENIAAAPAGDRHNAIYRAAARAGELIREGHLGPGSTFDAIVDGGLAVAGEKYTENEIVRTVRDAILEPSKPRMGGTA